MRLTLENYHTDEIVTFCSNIDRLVALWQTLYPYAWFTDPSQQLIDPGCYYVPPYSTPSPQTPLHPFRDGEAKLYTSDSIRDWFKFNYSYPELQPWLDKYKVDGKFSPELYYDDVVTQMNKLYGPLKVELQNLRPHALPENLTEGEFVHPDYLVDIEYSRLVLSMDTFSVTPLGYQIISPALTLQCL